MAMSKRALNRLKGNHLSETKRMSAPVDSPISIVLNDKDCTIRSMASGRYVLKDANGNEVTLSMRVILNCLAISEYRMDIPALPEAFWEHIEQGLQNK